MSVDILHIVGIDEVGRGPLAGPVTLCACKAARDFDLGALEGIKDSKQLSPEKRGEWFAKISELKSKGMLDFAFASVSAAEIDSLGIVPAIQKAMRSSLEALSLDPRTTRVLLDGSLKAPDAFTIQETIIKGDEKVPLISAASIVAKVVRDRHMEEQARIYPSYGFERHKGYGTDYHYHAIREHGVTPIHRKSFLSSVL